MAMATTGGGGGGGGQERGTGGGPRMLPPQVIVIGVDPSDYSRIAFEWALARLVRPGDRVAFVHSVKDLKVERLRIVDLPAGESHRVDSRALNLGLDVLDKEGRLFMAAFAERVTKADAIWETIIEKGDAREGIIKVAKEHDADMVLIGYRGMSTIKRMFTGSVTEYVVRHAPCPVVVVKAKGTEI